MSRDILDGCLIVFLLGMLVERDSRRREQKLVEKAVSGRTDLLSSAERAEADAIRARWDREAEERRSDPRP